MNIEQISAPILKGLIEGRDHQITLLSKREEDAYEKVDASLHRAIDEVIRASPDFDEAHYFQSDDWWPDRLRGVELGEALYSEKLLSSLQALLVREFKDFRIVLHIYSSLELGAPHTLSVLVTASCILATSENMGT